MKLGRLKYFLLAVATFFAPFLALRFVRMSFDLAEVHWLVVLILVAICVAEFYLAAARLRDIGLNPWLVLTALIPFLGLLVGATCLLVPTNAADTYWRFKYLPKCKPLTTVAQ